MKVPKLHMELVPSGVVEVTPLQVDNSHLRPRQSVSRAHDAVVPQGEARVRFRDENSYSRKGKKRAKNGTMEFVGSNSDD